MLTLMSDDPLAVAVTDAIRGGQVAALRALLSEHAQLATARIVRPDEQCRGVHTMRSLLHLATDWPGHYPNTVATITTLIAAGADVNAKAAGSHGETPLHWAASNDDLAALDALIDHGAHLEAPGAVIGGGPPPGRRGGIWPMASCETADRAGRPGQSVASRSAGHGGTRERTCCPGQATVQGRVNQCAVVRVPRRTTADGRDPAAVRGGSQLDRSRPAYASGCRPTQQGHGIG